MVGIGTWLAALSHELKHSAKPLEEHISLKKRNQCRVTVHDTAAVSASARFRSLDPKRDQDDRQRAIATGLILWHTLSKTSTMNTSASATNIQSTF